MNDCLHSYSYDAEGNLLQVDGGATAVYTYDVFNRRVRVARGGSVVEFLFNPQGQRVAFYDGNTLRGRRGQYYWGSMPLAYFTSGTYFQHGDWESTARLQTDAYGTVDGAYTSLPFGENLAGDDGSQDDGGGPANQDARHFAGLDHDFETNTDHATFRQYAPNQGRWLSPDPYNGSYDFSNPQSFNRYAYVENNPLTFTDPDGRVCSVAVPTPTGFTTSCITTVIGGAVCGPACGLVLSGLVSGVELLGKALGWWGKPAFHGNVQASQHGKNVPRNHCGPNGQTLSPPPGVNIARNAAITSIAVNAGVAVGPVGYLSVLGTYAVANWPGVGIWDYKKGLSEGPLRDQYGDAGNYNFGATCAALGLNETTCGNIAGQATRITNGGKLEGPGSWDNSPYGDQKRDAPWVQKGHQDAVNGQLCKID